MRKYTIGIVLGLVIAIVAIYLTTGDNSSTEPDIKIGVLKHESSLPIYVAEELGLFENQGLNVEIIEVPPGDHMPALISQRVDILSPTSFPVLFGIMQKNPGLVHAVFPGAEIADGPTVYGFVVSQSSTYTSVKDLAGRTVMAINPYTKLNIQTILASSGMPKDTWPEIKVAAREAALNAVSSGNADAAIMDQPALAIAVSSANFRLLEANPRAKHIGSPYWSGAGAVLTSHWRDNTATFLSLMKAIDGALDAIEQDPHEAHLILARRLALDDAIAEQMGGYYFPKSPVAVDLAGIQSTVDALVAAGLLEKPIALKGFFPPGVYGAQ